MQPNQDIRNQFRRYHSAYTPVAKKRKHPKVLVLLVAVIVSVVAVKAIWPNSSSVGQVAGDKVEAAAEPQPTPIDETNLSQQINQIITANPNLNIAVSLVDLKTGSSYNYGLSTAPFVAASTGKLLTAALYMHEVEQGKVSLSDTVAGATAKVELQKMIEDSDNTAWKAFNDELTHPALASYATSIGLKNYNADDNTLTSADLAVLLQQLYNGKLLNTEHTKLLLSYMQQANETQYIASAIPLGTKFYHKAGYLNDRALDAGIVDNNKRPYAIIIMTKAKYGSYNQITGAKIFQDITKITLEIFKN